MSKPLAKNANESAKEPLLRAGKLLDPEPAQPPEPPYKPYAEKPTSPEFYKPYAEKPALSEPLYEPYKGL